MDKQGIIYEILSKYILNYILDYVPDKNAKLKLFSYSKYFQNRLGIKKYYYYEKYLEALCFDINKYLCVDDNCKEKNELKKKYDSFISKNKIDKEKFGNILYEVINNQKEDYKNIDIDSPLFEIISRSINFYKYYTINIYQKNIYIFNLKEEYKIIFDKLNKSNTKYSAICYIYDDEAKLHYLNELNINFDNIIKMKLEFIEDDETIDIDCDDNSDKKTVSIINLFKSIKIKKLEILDLPGDEISDISLLKSVYFKDLKELSLSLNNISDIEILKDVKFKNLEKLNLSDNMISDINVLQNVNFKELKELDLSDNGLSDITVLEKVKFNKLEKLDLSGGIGRRYLQDISILENVHLIKRIKFIF